MVKFTVANKGLSSVDSYLQVTYSVTLLINV